ncbi:MAG: transketolase [Bacteroidetes bacterium]|nr:transketolase [Bacteroidota bacterium]
MTQKLEKSKSLASAIRIHALKMANRGGGSHIGSALSIADILAVLYSDVMNIDPSDPNKRDRDRFILSKGHAGAVLYAVLAEVGFFPLKKLETHYQDGSDLSGHISHKNVPGVELSTGSLGHGLSVGVGMAKAAKLDNKSHGTFVLLSDGECDEGSNWEAAMFASHHKLDNLVAIIDYNKIQSLDSVSNTLKLEPFKEKWESFGCSVQEVDGHDHNQLTSVLVDIPFKRNKPSVIIAHTIKGKGVSFMENKVLWHYRCPKGEEYKTALKELKNQ